MVSVKRLNERYKPPIVLTGNEILSALAETLSFTPTLKPLTFPAGISQSLPLILGSDISGIIQSVGEEVNAFRVGDEIYGITNERFTGGYADYAVAAAGMIAQKPNFVSGVDAVIDTVGGEIRERSLAVLKKGGILVSVVSPKTSKAKRPNDVRMVFFIVDVTTARLDRLTALFDCYAVKAQVGSVLSLDDARVAHQMLAGAPHNRGKIVLDLTA